MAVAGLKRILVGRSISSHKLEHQLLPKFLALPVFSSDPLSSVAYATEEMMLVLVAAGAGALGLKIPIALAIAGLLVIVVTSYRQTVRAYPRGGGSYIVARENLGTIPGLIAASAILTDYVLTVAVSVTAGTIAITSAAPALAEHKVILAVVLVALLTLANLRGVREAGQVFAIPTYGFVLMVYLTIAAGFVRCLAGCPQAATAHLPLEPLGALSLFLILKAFSSGATALTGVEAIADGVQAFRRPQSKNAAATLAIMGAISISMFIGITILADLLGVRVTEDIAATRSVLSQIGEAVFGRGLLFYLLQAFTAGILVLAANTSYQDFPRLSAILARDRFMPAQFRNRGDRLVFSNGVVVLALLASLLIYAFDANLTRLIKLYVVGVFTAFTLSQAGMVRRWLKVKGESWRRSMIINGIGAATTGVVLVIVTITKFREGAYIVVAAMPVIVGFFLFVHRHYESVGRALRTTRLSSRAEARTSFLLLVSDLGLATGDAVAYLRGLRPERVTPLYTGPMEEFPELALRWVSLAPRLGDLQPLPDRDRGLIRAVRSFLRTMPRNDDEFVTVVIPEALSSTRMSQFLRRGSLFWLKAALLFEGGVVICDVPLLPEERTAAARHADRPLEKERNVVLLPVSAVNDVTIRAVVYAKTLHSRSLEALFFASDPEEVPQVIEAWAAAEIDIPLAIVDAPFRDIGPPLLEEIRHYTARGDAVVTVILPELVVRRWWEHFLHGQTGLYIKRLLLFEPDVVVTSVPHRV
ncbi:MAG TPA: APC family permease [Actinomycetota bacterium]|nr:APC family permease [Actinomycetota bacterium]